MKKVLIVLVIVGLVVYYFREESNSKPTSKPFIRPIASQPSSLPPSFKKPFIPAQSSLSAEEIITQKVQSTLLLTQPNEPKTPVLNAPDAKIITSNSDEQYRQQVLGFLKDWGESFSNEQQKSKVMQIISLLQVENKARWEYLQGIWSLRGMEGFEFYLGQSFREWVNLPVSSKPTDAPTDYGWLTDDNLEFILGNHQGIQRALVQRNQTNKQFNLRTDLANIYNAFMKAKSKQDWPLVELLAELEWNKAQYVLLPLRVNGNHWGLVVLEDLTFQEAQSSYQVWYTSSGGGSLEQEKKQIEPFISQICGEMEIKVIEPVDRESKGYECGVYLVRYVEEILERGRLELKRQYTETDYQNFRWEWKKRIGEKWCCWN